MKKFTLLLYVLIGGLCIIAITTLMDKAYLESDKLEPNPISAWILGFDADKIEGDDFYIHAIYNWTPDPYPELQPLQERIICRKLKRGFISLKDTNEIKKEITDIQKLPKYSNTKNDTQKITRIDEQVRKKCAK